MLWFRLLPFWVCRGCAGTVFARPATDLIYCIIQMSLLHCCHSEALRSKKWSWRGKYRSYPVRKRSRSGGAVLSAMLVIGRV
jgi:hypothetical protein